MVFLFNDFKLGKCFSLFSFFFVILSLLIYFFFSFLFHSLHSLCFVSFPSSYFVSLCFLRCFRPISFYFLHSLILFRFSPFFSLFSSDFLYFLRSFHPISFSSVFFAVFV